MFSLKTFSFWNAYIGCVGEQLRDALNDPGRLGNIYQGLINYILAKNGGAHKIPHITKQVLSALLFPAHFIFSKI
jgi:hypothetical protein